MLVAASHCFLVLLGISPTDAIHYVPCLVVSDYVTLSHYLRISPCLGPSALIIAPLSATLIRCCVPLSFPFS